MLTATSTVAATPTYTSQQLVPSSDRRYLALNNGTRILTLRQDSPTPTDQHIVIEDWSDGGRSYSEFRPGTLPGTTRSVANAFNDSRDIVGYAETADADGNLYAPDGYTPLLPPRAFLYRGGAFTDLSALPPLNAGTVRRSSTTGINGQGDAVGSWTDAAGEHAFLYSDGVITDIGALSSATTPADTRAIGINSRGQIAGTSRLPPGAGPGSNAWPHAFLYDQGVMTDLGTLPGYEWSQAVAMNDAGDVVGTAHMGNHAVSCFIYSDGTLKNMGLLGSAGSSPYCQVHQINDAGVAVGYANANPVPPDFRTSAPFVYSDGQMHDLNSLLDPNDPLARNGVRLADALAINDKGEIIAATSLTGSASYYLLTPVTATPGTDAAQYHFETDTQGWSSTAEPIIVVSTSTARAFAGRQALAVGFSSEGFASVAVMQPPVPAGRTVTFHVYLPADTHLDWIQPFVLEGLEGNWRWSGNWQPVAGLLSGAWNTLTVDVPVDATSLWSMGVEFHASQPNTGTAYIDSVGF